MPAVYIPPPSASTTISAPGNTVTNRSTALAGLRQALIKSVHWITPRKSTIYLVAVAGVAIFSAIWYALVRGRRRLTAAASAAAKCHEGKRPEWATEKGWLQREGELGEQREEERKREERERQKELEMLRQQGQEPQHRRRWSDFTPNTFTPYSHPTPHPAPHLFAAMLPQPTIQPHPHSYPPPQFPPPSQQGQLQLPPTQYQFPPLPCQDTATRLTKHWDESHERIIGAVVVGRRGGTGIRRHVRVFGT
ncbi:MAG: hypothetical protein M1840_007005 [Geoglossum simile]|nr:MAG: hypothetical protein M1840_007005 [Geoglossum simile]